MIYLYNHENYVKKHVHNGKMLMNIKRKGWDTRFYKHQEGVNDLTHICEHAMSEHSKMDLCMLSHFSHVQLFVSLWTIACQTPLSMGLSRQEY